MIRALRHRNYRLFFSGQAISLIGTWVQDVTLSWLIYHLTGSAFLLGAIFFCKQIPVFLLGPLSGVAADRYDRRKIIIAMQVLSMLQAMLLAVLVLGEQVQVWHILALSLFLGVVNAFDLTARQSFVFDMVQETEDMHNAIALNSLIFNAARLIGPSVAAALLALVGAGVCFLLNAVSFAGTIGALLAMRIHRGMEVLPVHKSAWKEIEEVYIYASRFLPIWCLLLLIALVSLTAMPYTLVLMPIVNAEIYDGTPYTLGLLMSATGGGAICGAAVLARRSHSSGLEKVIPFAAALLGIGLILFSQTLELWPAVIILFFTGLGMIVHSAASNTMLQTVVDADKRGRIMGLYSMANSGMLPFGNLFAGFFAGQVGAPFVLLLGGASCLLGAGLFIWQLPRIQECLGTRYDRTGTIL